MGVAIAYALAQPAAHLILVFSSLGLGLALPYLLLSNWPLLQRCMPKPGVWMERLKQAFAFPMYATALWLSWVLVHTSRRRQLLYRLRRHARHRHSRHGYSTSRAIGPLESKRRAATLLSAAARCSHWRDRLRCACKRSPRPAASASALNAEGKNWEPYSEEKLQDLRAEGKPVFLNFTAAWCITCLANERVALSKDNVMA